MDSPTRFRARSFWVSYICFSLIALALARMHFDTGGELAILLAIIFPIPFFLSGYFARQIGYSILFALLVLVLLIAFFLFGLPALGRVFEHR
jgi:hypothetical protein